MQATALEDGTRMYRVSVSPVLTGNGLSVMLHEGEIATRRGSDVVAVRWDGGCNYELDKWHTDKAAAYREAAEQIERYIAPAIAQAKKFRGEETNG